MECIFSHYFCIISHYFWCIISNYFSVSVTTFVLLVTTFCIISHYFCIISHYFALLVTTFALLVITLHHSVAFGMAPRQYIKRSVISAFAIAYATAFASAFGQRLLVCHRFRFRFQHLLFVPALPARSVESVARLCLRFCSNIQRQTECVSFAKN